MRGEFAREWEIKYNEELCSYIDVVSVTKLRNWLDMKVG
jgi:hypothetical protein